MHRPRDEIGQEAGAAQAARSGTGISRVQPLAPLVNTLRELFI
jgi:hypothetical protein